MNLCLQSGNFVSENAAVAYICFRVRNLMMYLLIGVLFTLSAAINCNDGNRGGCSHTCYENVCICPTCWMLDDTGLSCIPATNKVKITCSASGMAVLVDQCVFPGDRTVTLRGNHCQGKTDPNGSLLFSTTLEQCDTQLKIDYENQQATFRNSVIGKPRRQKGIMFGRVLSFDFECTYDMNYTDIASNQDRVMVEVQPLNSISVSLT